MSHASSGCWLYLIHFFSQDLPHFSRDFAYVHWNIPKCSPIRIFIFGRRFVPILKTLLLFFFKFRRRRTAGRPRDRARHFETKFSGNQSFDRDRRGLGPAVLCCMDAGELGNDRLGFGVHSISQKLSAKTFKTLLRF